MHAICLVHVLIASCNTHGQEGLLYTGTRRHPAGNTTIRTRASTLTSTLILHRPPLHQPRGMAEHAAQGTPSYITAGCSRPYGIHRRSIFVIIARDFTDHVAINSDLRAVNAERTHTPSV
jgi:hypothetical protein